MRSLTKVAVFNRKGGIKITTNSVRNNHFRPWKNIEPIGLDAIKQLTLTFQKDSTPGKVLLGEGVYRDDKLG